MLTLLMMSVLLVLSSFIRMRITTKYRDAHGDYPSFSSSVAVAGTWCSFVYPCVRY